MIKITINSSLLLVVLLLIGLKIFHVITWSWLWVLAPLWVPVALLIVFGVVAIIYLGISVILAALSFRIL